MSVSPQIDWLAYCDATRETGLGHLARCLGYAEALVQNGQSVQFLGHYTLFAESMIRAIDMPLENLGEVARGSIDECFHSCSEVPERGLLMDSYTLSTKDLSSIRERFADQRIVLLDDFGDRPEYICDAVVNFTVAADARVYPASVETFLGPQFYPARAWLREAREERLATRLPRLSDVVDRWLLICGGTDFCQVTHRLVDTLATCVPNAKLRVLLANGVDAAKLEQKLQSFVEYEIIQPTTDLKEAFVWADACICGGGLTKYECLFSGVSVASFAQTASQQADTDAFVRLGLIGDLGPAYASTDELPIQAFSSYFNSLSSVALPSKSRHSIVGAGDEDTILRPFDPNQRHI